MDLFTVINNCSRMFSQEWRVKYSPFLVEERWETFSNKLTKFLEQGYLHSLPYFNEEIIPPLQKIRDCFEFVLHITQIDELSKDVLLKKWAYTIEKIPFEYFLIILGQRLTFASLQDEQAVPPLRETLLTSTQMPFNDQISISIRAWEKHIGRSRDDFWGIMIGSPKEKEVRIKSLILTMLNEQTWWNIFCHYKHGFVYEIRVASGHGIRWNKEGTELIGFLEPFLNEE